MGDDLYGLLGVQKDATVEDIKKAYKKLAMKHHPDRGGDEETFKKISEAYAVLTDNEKRSMYDRFGTVDMANVQMPDMSDLMENLFGFSFGGGGMFGGSRSQQQNRVPDRREIIELALSDIFTGAMISFVIKRRVLKKSVSELKKCAECQGKGVKIHIQTFGFMQQQSVAPCMSCAQTGYMTLPNDYVTRQDTLQITIPKGIPDGHQIVLKEKTDEQPGLKTGDVILIVRYKKHALFRPIPDTNDLLVVIDVTLEEAICGFTRDIPFLDGSTLRVRLPEGHILCQKAGSGQHIRKTVHGYGLSSKHKTRDLILEFNIHFPVLLDNNSIRHITSGLSMRSLDTMLPRCQPDAFIKEISLA